MADEKRFTLELTEQEAAVVSFAIATAPAVWTGRDEVVELVKMTTTNWSEAPKVVEVANNLALRFLEGGWPLIGDGFPGGSQEAEEAKSA